ncbi:hypothetical protein C8F04DRAFT_1127487 [Mycena alexandri]|uniref:MYND-type domain-containing protein n=1 Tax=Mycena alexandri TaxID=1745969 RepID=A0AAD6SD68_9AGAR|nr:hypothetical protein C8F04DRAFT_1127487 [Mycena alexandri]
MAHALVFQGKYFFYPIGNTSAVSLLRDIAPEEPANLLLLGCGDPRNVLYSIFSEHSHCKTCFLVVFGSRNVLFFTLVADNQVSQDVIWNIFFHFYLGVQCKKLLDIGETLRAWDASAYGPFIKMGTQYTLDELRRHWALYSGYHDLPVERRNASRTAKDLGIGARSAGPLIDKATKVCEEQFLAYWKTGTTFSKTKDTATASFLNPTFVYSLVGEGCNVHYGTDPVAPFHLAALFGSGIRASVTDLVKIVKAEFSRTVLRFFASEATALCKALGGFDATGALNLGIFLNPAEYGSAPSTFNVIDSSNLSDHIGLLNVLIATVPLLRSPASCGSVLYTESLTYHGKDATKEFAESLYADIHTVGALLNLAPTDYVGGFSSRSNTHELIAYMTGRQNQFHQTTTWKAPASGDRLASSGNQPLPPVYDARQLGTLLYDIYHQLFEQEDSHHFWRLNQDNVANAVAASNIVHYIRESFVLFLKLVRKNLQIPNHLWLDADKSLPMDSVNYQDLAAHLHLHGVHTIPFLHITEKKVRVILVVPREKFVTLGTPILQCDTRGQWSHNQFTAVHAAFGTSRPRGRKGSSPIVISFTMSARLLTLERPEDTRICCSQTLFSANVMDADHVYILPQDPFPSPKPAAAQGNPNQIFEIGQVEPVVVELDEECELISSLTSMVLVENTDAKHAFSTGTMPEISQLSPCVMRLAVGGRSQNLVYPIPINGMQNKLRLARKSLYIEVIVPPSGPFKQGGMKVSPFPVVGMHTSLHPWNIHRLNLSSLPILNVKTPVQKKWVNIHLGSMMSAREYALRKAHEDDALMRVKETINTIFVRSSGAQGGDKIHRLFNLVEKESNNCDTVLFVSDLKFDLSSHTIVCDGYVLPLTKNLLSRIEVQFRKLIPAMYGIPVSKVEIAAWKRLMPALVERCRTWKHTDTCEYIVQGKVPLTDEMERDPLCSCGKGKDVDGMLKVPEWSKLARFAVRIAFSPLFAVSYLEKVGRDPAAGRCFVCRGKGKPKMMKCTACGKVRYCSKECQSKDWKAHKPKCKQAVVKV